VALLVIPPAAARFWTESLPVMTTISAGIGAVSGMIGALLSATHADLPAGAIIVLMCSSCFVFSLLFGLRRGVLVTWLRGRNLEHKVARQNLLRSLYERTEVRGAPKERPLVPLVELQGARSWSGRRLRSAVRRAEAAGLVARLDNGVRLTAEGILEAERVVRNHRLWEMYLITHADIAPSHVDRDADAVEHVLGADLVARLEAAMAQSGHRSAPPPSQHRIDDAELGLS
jgi:manganese/zinc/iron transport system permease protein